MDEDILRFSTSIQPAGNIKVAVRGYLDDDGARALAREILIDLPDTKSHIDIDLNAVTLFNCSGARRLLAAVDDLHDRGREVALVGVHQPLQRLINFAA